MNQFLSSHLAWSCCALVGLCALLLGVNDAEGATATSANFVVRASTIEIAEAVASAAEHHRERIAQTWLGTELGPWEAPCEITVTDRSHKATGWARFDTLHGQLDDLGIELQGPVHRLLETVLPHEMTHLVLASHFGWALPRWADEGIAMMSESEAVRRRQHLRCETLLQSSRTPAISDLWETVQYPTSRVELLTFYATSLSLTEFLVLHAGRERLMAFLSDRTFGDWDAKVRRHFDFESVEGLESAWKSWVRQKSSAKASLVQWDEPAGDARLE